MTELRLRRADDLAVVERRLARNGLPTDDLRSAPGRFFLGVVSGDATDANAGEPGMNEPHASDPHASEPDAVESDAASGADARANAASDGERDERVVGVGGFEQYGADALLRSVVIDRAVRGAGYGTALCDGIERRAREAGVESMWALTTTAEGFFADRGYERVERAGAPASIRRTAQFAEICPDSATLLAKRLA